MGLFVDSFCKLQEIFVQFGQNDQVSMILCHGGKFFPSQICQTEGYATQSKYAEDKASPLNKLDFSLDPRSRSPLNVTISLSL
jgi:hypothetical protein